MKTNARRGVIRKTALIIAAGVLYTSTHHTHAIEGLELSVRCPDVILSWPSATGETYIVQYRTTLYTNSSWVTLSNSLPAATGTNLTTFVHSNQVDCPAGQFFGMTMRGGEQAESAITTAAATPLSAEERKQLAENLEQARLEELVARCKLEGREPYVWEVENRPPWPWEPTKLILPQTQSAGSLSAFSSESSSPLDSGGSTTNAAFYRVVRNGAYFFGITNDFVLSGIVEIPIEFSVSNTDQISGVSFYADGSPLVGASEKNDGAPWLMEWDTRMVPNGNYAINLGIDFDSSGSVTSSPVTVAVSNPIAFPNYFTRIFGNWMWVYAELSVTQADYEVALYADETNYIGYFGDTTTNGVISFIWDLTDGGSYTYTNETFMAVFSVTPTSQLSGSSPTATNYFAKERSWSGIGKFVVAYSPLDNNGTTTDKIRLMVAGGENGEYFGVVQSLNYLGLGGYELSPGNSIGQAFEMSDSTTKTNLLSYLSDSAYRNFYYFGHGSASAIGSAPSTTVPTITQREIRRYLGNYLSSAKPANSHPYRLVFMDGCSAGAGNICEVFGMPVQTVNNLYFQYAGVRSRAFLGFTKDISFNPAQWSWGSLTLGWFFLDWQAPTNTLQACVSNAVNGVHTSGFGKLDSSYVIQGAANLTIYGP